MVNQAEYVIHICVVTPQEYVNIYSTRRPVGQKNRGGRWRVEERVACRGEELRGGSLGTLFIHMYKCVCVYIYVMYIYIYIYVYIYIYIHIYTYIYISG